MLRNPFPSFNELLSFRNQYAIAKNLDLPSIVKPLTLEPYENAYALVMEDFGGISLKEVLKREGNMGHSPQILLAFHQLNPNVPLAVSVIVGKLMAKNAEDRYQSALGLKHDLEICLHQLKETGTIQSFELGARDLCDRFLIPEKLYGRESEVQTLLEAFDRIAGNTSKLMCV